MIEISMYLFDLFLFLEIDLYKGSEVKIQAGIILRVLCKKG